MAPQTASLRFSLSQIELLEQRQLLSASVTTAAAAAGDDYGNTAATATAIETNATIRGRLEGPKDVDWFSFHADVEHSYLIKVNGSERISWGDGSGQWTLPYDNSFKPQKDGTYYIMIGVDDNAPSNYDLTIEESTDGNDTLETATPWKLGTVVESDLPLVADIDYYRFEAKAGDTWVFNVREPKLVYLYDAKGNNLGQLSVVDGVYDQDMYVYGRWTVPTSGTYYISVDGYSSFSSYGQSGPYMLRALLAPKENPCAPGNLLKISAGQTVTRTIAPAAEDVFAFEAKAGTYYKFALDYPADAQARFFMSVVEPGEPGVRGDNSRFSVDNGWDLLREASFVASKSGTYHFSVTALDAARSGPYRLTLISKSDDHANDQNQATAITPGKVMRGVMQYDGDVDYFVLNAKAGRKYTVTFTSDSDHYFTSIDLKSADKSLPGIPDTPPTNTLTFTAARSGKYYFSTVGQIYDSSEVKYAIAVSESGGKTKSLAGKHKGRGDSGKAHHHRRRVAKEILGANSLLMR